MSKQSMALMVSLVVLLLLLFASPLKAATVTIYPNANSTANAYTASGAATVWQATLSQDSAYATATSPSSDLYVNLDNPSLTGATINSVTIYVRALGIGSDGVEGMRIQYRITDTGSEVTNSTVSVLTTSYATYSWTPAGPFTPANITDLVVGMVGYRVGGANITEWRADAIWVVVNYTLAANNPPTASASSMTGLDDPILAGIQYQVSAVYSDPDGAGNLANMHLRLDHNATTDIEFYCTEAGATGSGNATVVTGSAYLVGTPTFSYTSSGNNITVTWTFTVDWDWVESLLIEYGVYCTDDAAANSGAFSLTTIQVQYENDLTFTGTVTANGAVNGALTSGVSWVQGNEQITWSGLTVVYEGMATSPNNSDFDIRITDDDTGVWTQTAGAALNLTSTADATTDPSDPHNIDIINIPPNGSDVSSVTFEIKTDADIPENISGLAAPSSTGETVTLTWTPYQGNEHGAIDDSGFDSYVIYYSQTSPVTTSSSKWDSTNDSSLSNYATGTITVTGLNPGTTYYFNIVGKDKARNQGPIVGANEVSKATTSIIGDGYLLRRNNTDETCGGPTSGCHNLQIHNAASTGSSYWGGTWGSTFTCRTCHTPHGTKNIYMIKETITTPNSGDKPVIVKTLGIGDPYNDPDPTPGDPNSGVMADATDGVYTGVCEVCHTITNQHRNTSGAPVTTHNNAKNCTGCHLHTVGFKKGGESEGGNSCSSCHSELFNPMNTSTTTYHHYLQNSDPVYALLSQPAQLTANDVNRRCLMCHVDHDIFRPDKNSDGGRGKNLRTNISTTPSKGDTSTYTNTDFVNSGNGGVCLSCHINTQTKSTVQKSDGSTQTPAWSIADFQSTTHQYTVQSTFNGGLTNTFNANCVKCHNDDMTKDKQTSTYKFGPHNSSMRHLLDPLGGSAAESLEENFCYRCHSGGVAGNDYYGVTSMSLAAKSIQSAFAKTYKHPITSTTGVHKPAEYITGAPNWNPASNRHVECADCHNPHAARAGLHTSPGNAVAPANQGAWGVEVTNGAAGTVPTFTKVASITKEYQLCFKCHSSYAYGATPPSALYPDGTSGATQSDPSVDFNPNNKAHHAVEAPGNKAAGGNFALSFVSPYAWNQTVTCSDCHAMETRTASAPSPGPGGPHGSTQRYILKKFYNSSNATWSPVLCYNCHNYLTYGYIGDANSYTSPSDPNMSYSRIDHPINSAMMDNTYNVYGIACMSCHGGVKLGGLHGSNMGLGQDGGTANLGDYLLNGSDVTGFTPPTTSVTGKCWVNQTYNTIFNKCPKNHSGVNTGTSNW